MKMPRIVEVVIGFLMGDDVFVSYSRKDGAVYAEGLAAKLARRGYSCRVDLWETVPGVDLPLGLVWRLRRSRMLLLIGTKGAMSSPNVAREIREFLQTHRVIIPIEVGEPIEKASWFHLIKGLAKAEETNPNALKVGKPSKTVLDRVVNSVTFTRRNRRIQYAAGVALLVLAVASAWSVERTAAAARATANAAKASHEANVQTELAAQRRREATSMTANSGIIQARLSNPERLRDRTVAAINAYRNYPNALSAQLLAETLSAANHHVARFTLPNTAVVVSRNGLYAAAEDKETHIVTVYRIGKQLERQWLVSPAEARQLGIEALAISGDGRTLAISWLGKNSTGRALAVFRRDGDETAAGREVFRDTDAPGRSLAFEDLRFTPDGTYLWGVQLAVGLVPDIPQPILYHCSNAGVERLVVPLPALRTSLRVVAVSDDAQYVGLVVPQADGATSAPRIVSFSLPDLREVASFTSPVSYPQMLAFDPADSQNLLIGGEESSDASPQLYTSIQRWPSPDRVSEPIEGVGDAVTDLRRIELLPWANAAVLFGGTRLDWDPTGERSISADIVSDYRGSPRLAGKVLNLGPDTGSSDKAGELVSIGVRREDRTIVTSDHEGHIVIWEPFFRHGVQHPEFAEEITDLSTTADPTQIVVADLHMKRTADASYPETVGIDTVTDWASVARRVERRLELQVRSRTVRLAVSHSGAEIASFALEPEAGWRDGAPVIHLHSVTTGQKRKTLRLAREPESFFDHHEPATIVWGWDDRRVASVNGLGEVSIWDVARDSTDPIARFKAHEFVEEGHELQFSHDGSVLLISFGNSLQAWSVGAGNPEMKWQSRVGRESDGQITAVKVSARDKFVAAATTDGIVVFLTDWQGRSPKTVRTVVNPRRQAFNSPVPVIDMDFHPSDDDMLAVLDIFELTVLSAMDTEPWIRVDQERLGGGAVVKFSRDGRHVLTTAGGRTGYAFWLWRPEDLIAEACQSFLLDERDTPEGRQACPRR